MAKPIVVMKFGGTSVASEGGRAAVADRIREGRAAGKDVVAVVSAMGRKGDPYATDSLLGLLPVGAADDRERDMLASCGEIVSAVVLAHLLRAEGVEAAAYTGAEAGIVTDGAFGEARILRLHPHRLLQTLERGVTPVVAGFQGGSEEGDVTTLGRGGSDTTACALGVALHAESVEIYTDVDGVMTADPRECGEARVLDAVEFEELFQMAHAGAKVMHAPAAELAMGGGVPVRVRNTFSDAPGTIVDEVVPPKGVATAVSHLDGIAQLRVDLKQAGDDPLQRMPAQTAVYRALAAAGVSLDMFTPCAGTLVFTVAEGQLPDALRVLERLEMPHEVTTGLAKVTLVGAGMRGVPGVMAKVADALCEANVPILQTADSHTTIAVLVWQNMRKAAVRALHEAFGLAQL